ncbi:flavin-binding monooxygenase [Colletotrichum incanum]|uniref:Flavin-binding monooxygenase n=1 Tax=Colletotrichum incanum TaxID=1573173 RepID=A0A161WDQ5_COLIC|nr:flavin-binding monooxygenase [Colletotrichum incanum]OHW97973.1 flavin-binding monooxygenase [Colletotrichum incanum]
MGSFSHIDTSPTIDESFDYIIVGAGISGINTAYYLQAHGPPNATYAILEGRARMGGTWDLFRYPGIRSDSDIYTFGFSWNPWKGKDPLAQGRDICSYLEESASMHGIDRHIRYHHQVMSADWNSATSRWVLQAAIGGEKVKTISARFIVLGTGYYDYEQPLAAEIPDIQNFQGQVVHPQFWPEDLDYRNKNVVVIGSGATAVTLLPNIATDAARVTMLQRSPTYIVGLPSTKGAMTRFLISVLPRSISGRILRAQYFVMGTLLYYYCQWFPRSARRLLLGAAEKQLPPNIPLDPHFKPRYNPWEQRLCVCPNNDFYAALRSGKADVVTAHIYTVTSSEIILKGGTVLRPDIIITATGLKIRFGGSISLSVDSVPMDLNTKFAYKGCMLQDIPNLAFVFGYTNASWTLGAEATSSYLVRLWRSMEAKGVMSVTPHPEDLNMKPKIAVNLKSTYLLSAGKVFPKFGTGLWAARRNYFMDLWSATVGDVFSGLQVR